MKYLKMLGLAAVAAAALMAFAGAGTASATELCKVTETPCSAANMYTAGTVLHADLKEGTVAALTAGFATVNCSESTIKLEQLNTGSSTETVRATVRTLTFGGCNCTFIVLENANKDFGDIEIHTDVTGKENHSGIVTGSATSPTKTTITCSGVSCNFTTEGVELGTLDESPSATSHAVLTVNTKLKWSAGDSSNFVCTLGAGTASWKAEYTFTEPKPLYVN